MNARRHSNLVVALNLVLLATACHFANAQVASRLVAPRLAPPNIPTFKTLPAGAATQKSSSTGVTLPDPARTAVALSPRIIGSIAPVTATQNGFNTVDLKWNAASIPGVSYLVKGPGLPPTGVATTATQLHLTNIPAGAGQAFTVSGARAGIPVGGSGTATVDVSPVLVDQPNLYIYGSNGGPTQTVDINYYSTMSGVGLRLFKQDTSGNYNEVTIALTEAYTLRYFDHTLNQGWNYNYRILVTLPNSTQVWSNVATVSIPVANLQMVIMANPTRIHLSWNPFAIDGNYTIQKMGPTNFQVYSAISDASGKPVTFSNVYAYDDPIVGPSQMFYYLVCGFGPLGKICAGGLDFPVKIP